VLNLLSVESSRLTSLFLASRPQGQPPIPGGFAELVKRYSFAGFPTKLDELDSTRVAFRLGSFEGIGIDALEIYPDGVIVSAKAPTDVLDAFLNDLTQWMESALGLKRIETQAINRNYESSILVQSDVNILKHLDALKPVRDLVSKSLHAAVGLELEFESFGISLAADHSRIAGMKPIPFRVERRAGIPFENNYFLSAAPLRTADHLKVLEKIERLAAR
jgi:hypothetical protein